MIEKNDLIELNFTKHPRFPVIDSLDIMSGLKKIFDLYKVEIPTELTEDNVYDWYTGNNYDTASISGIRHPKALTKFFSHEQIVRMMISSPYTLEPVMSDYLEQDKIYTFVHNISMSLWHNGAEQDWNSIAKFNNACMTFNPFPDNQDIDVAFDVTSYAPNPFGRSKYGNFYLDGELSFVLRYKGINSFIVSVDVIKGDVIHIKQIQSVIPKRNKMRFVLGDNFFEKIIAEFISHFHDYSVYLITGKGIVSQIEKEGKNLEEVDNSAYNRVMSTYSQEFVSIQRNEIKDFYKMFGFMSPHSAIEFQEISLAS